MAVTVHIRVLLPSPPYSAPTPTPARAGEFRAVARAAHQGARELNLTVLSGNAAARRLYARLGFIETTSGAHIAMSKPLGD